MSVVVLAVLTLHCFMNLHFSAMFLFVCFGCLVSRLASSGIRRHSMATWEITKVSVTPNLPDTEFNVHSG